LLDGIDHKQHGDDDRAGGFKLDPKMQRLGSWK